MKRLNSNVHDITLTGCVLWASEDGQPLLVVIEGRHYLPVYSTKSKADLHRGELLVRQELPPLTAKVIDDGKDFLASLADVPLGIMLDPWVTPEGNTRFLEIVPPGRELPPVGEVKEGD